MKTKILNLFLLLVASIGIVFASETQVDGIWYYFDSSTKIASVTFRGSKHSDYENEYQGNIVIPSSVVYKGATYRVTSIADLAFAGCPSLTSITIPNSVTYIGSYAFTDCFGLSSVQIPNTVTYVGSYAFRGCSVDSMNYLGTLHDWLIKSWEQDWYPASYQLHLNGVLLEDVSIPESITSIGDYAFDGFPNIVYNGVATGSPWGARSVNGYMEGPLVYSDETKTDLIACSKAIKGELEIPNSVTSIGERAFRDCTGLTSVTIPNSVTSIGSSTFYGCTGLTSVTIPNSVTSIGQSAFYRCENLKSISIPNSVTSIGSGAFSNCASLTSVSIPNNITRIEEGTFFGCSSLASIIIPKDVTYIGNDAFYGCRNLTSIEWNAKNCNAYKFGGQLESVVFGNEVENIPNSLCEGKTNITSIVVPNNVISIGENAFIRCSNLQTLTLGENITTYGNGAFSGCSALTSIYNYRRTPVALSADVFKNVDYFACTLYVLEGSVDMYKSDRSSWKDFFYNIEPISAISTTTGNDILVTPTDNTANIVWPQVNGAEIYELVIKDKSGTVICTLIFNAQGQLTSIAFSAPSRNNVPQKTQTVGFAFTVTGLNSGTNYDLVMTSKNSNGGTIQTKTVSFTTTGNAQSVENILGGNAQSTKIFRNGQIYILRGDKTYTLTGFEVK